VYVWYNAKGTPKHKQTLSRFTWDPTSETFDPNSELKLIHQEEESPYHNGGTIAFGPDGFLYFGNGDDENKLNHQTITRGLFCGLFRIDVDKKGGSISRAPSRQPTGATTQEYFVPLSNPFIGTANAVEEFYALGLRNPYKFSFDKITGDLYVGEVGETFREEIDKISAGDNCEYPYREGSVVRETGDLPITIGNRRGPFYEYGHGETGDIEAVLGGYVYRGTRFPELVGKYIFSSWITGRIWALDISGPTPVRTTLMDNRFGYEGYSIAEDNDGELYVLGSYEPTTEEPT